MANIHKSITELVGKTPLLELSGYEKKNNLGGKIIAKLEYLNPNGSVKDRIALEMIEEAEKSGELKRGDTIVEATSGNTGIGLAGIAAAKGYPFRVYVQDNVSKERFQVMKAFGAETIKFLEEPVVKRVSDETNGDFVAALKALKEEVFDKEENIYFANQLGNQANPDAHRKTTGPEIWEDTDGKVDVFIACVGTGGTLSGTGAYLKEKNPDVKVIGVQPGPNSLPSPENPTPAHDITGVHPFEGVPENLIPATMDTNIYDECIAVEALDAIEEAREVAKSDGVLVGTSSGAALRAAKIVAARPEYKDKNIVVIFPDTGLRYLSTDLFAAEE